MGTRRWSSRLRWDWDPQHHTEKLALPAKMSHWYIWDDTLLFAETSRRRQSSRCTECSKGKDEDQYICIAPYWRQPTSKVLRYGNALSRNLTVLPAHPRICPQMEWTIPAFAFPAEAGTHLPTPKGWKAELAWATRTVSKQSAQDCYVMFIAAANRSKHHASLGK